MKIFLDNIRFIVRSWCGASPIFIQLIGKIRGFDSNICSRKTDVVIEAFPRSANTFCVAVFRVLSSDRLSIASHMHSAAQFRLASRYDKPALLIVRSPLDAISSLSIRRPLVKKKHLIKEYIAFHEKILPLVLDGKVIVMRFDDLVGGKLLLPEVVHRVLGRDFEVSSMPQDSLEDKVVDLVEAMERRDSGGILRETHVARPSNKRNKIKGDVVSELLEERKLITKANSLYMKFSKAANLGV